MKESTKENRIFLHLDLSKFKTLPCNVKIPHKVKMCFFYHFKTEKRRCLDTVYYKKVACPIKKACKNEFCGYAHNSIEELYHPDNYKKKYCKDFITKKECKYKRFCAHAHSDFEFKTHPIHFLNLNRGFLLFRFKTEFCPFLKINHDRYKCPFAHNFQDFKRPYQPKLAVEQCNEWDTEKEIT